MAPIRPLDILYIGVLPPHQGGSAVSISQLLLGIVKSGHTIRAIAAIREDALKQGDWFAAEHPALSLRRYAIPFDHTATWTPLPPEVDQHECDSIRTLFREAIAERRPDVVFLGREASSIHAMPAAREFGLPVVIRITGGVEGIRRGLCPKPRAKVLLEAMKQATLLCPQAEHMAATLRSLGLTRIKTIPNLVDMDLFAPRKTDGRLRRQLAIGDKHLVVLHMSNMKEMKRPDDIVRAAPQILAEQPDTTFVIAGNGPARDKTETICREKGLSRHFRFVDWVPYDAVPEFLNSADIVVMTSEFEHQARMYLESQACGRLLVSSDVPGAREVMEDGKTCLLFRMGDTDDLARKILLAASDPPLRARIGRQAREQVRRHDITQVVSSYISALYGVVNPPSSVEESYSRPSETPAEEAENTD